MLTLTTEHKEKLQAAHERGKGLEVVASQQPGVYYVRSGSDFNKLYQVTIWKEAGEVKTECSCPAGKYGDFCKHLGAAAKVYQDYLKAQQEPVAAIAYCKNPDCGAPATTDEGRCEACQLAFDRECLAA
jgi:hypothetical protein